MCRFRKKGMALGKRAWRWRKGAWRGAIVKVARGNTNVGIVMLHFSQICNRVTALD